jgi:lipoprotein-releasing system permease protein
MLFSAFERTVALRYLRARRREGFISLIAGFSLAGIALGVGTLIVVLSVMNGFQSQLLGRIQGLNGHFGLFGPGGSLTHYLDMGAEIERLPGGHVLPTLENQAMAVSPKGSSGAVVRGLRPEDLAQLPMLDKTIKPQGARLEDGTVIVGARLAEKLGLKVGDDVTLIAPKGTVTAFGTVPRMRPYRIVGTFEAGMYEYDNAFVYMPLPAAQLFFQMPDAVTHLQVFVGKPGQQVDQQDIDLRRIDIIRLVSGRARLYDWQQVNASFFEAVKVERNVMFLILALIVLVAAFNIISSLIMMVKDKTRAVAILRTMGATRGAIMRIFFLDGAAVGVVGTAVGVLLGTAFARNIETIRAWLQGWLGVNVFNPEIYFLSELPSQVHLGDLGMVVGMSLALSFAATLYPSWRAARLDPVEALRYE